jgi:hypothetical protein
VVPAGLSFWAGEFMHALFRLEAVLGGKNRMRFLRSFPDLAKLLRGEEWKDGGENIFYSTSHCKNIPAVTCPWKNKGEDFEALGFVYFDLDHLDPALDLGAFVERAVDPLVVAWAGEGVERYYVSSGHGLHILVRIPSVIRVEWFGEVREAYRHFALDLENLLRREGVDGEADLQVFDPTRSLRVPGTVNAKAGMPLVECRLIAAFDGGPSEVFRRLLEEFKIPAADRSRGIPKQLLADRVLELKGTIEHKRYFHVMCPFHEETTPSLVVYKDGMEFGYDLHVPRGEPGYRVPLFHVWCQAKYGVVDETKRGEFEGQAPGASPGAARGMGAADIIRRWSDTAMRFKYSICGKLYSEALNLVVTRSAFSGLYDTVILARLVDADEAHEGKNPMGARGAPGLFRDFAPAVFAQYVGLLPSVEEVERGPEDATGEAVRAAVTRAIFVRQQVTDEATGQRRFGSLVTGLAQMRSGPSGWRRIPEFPAFMREENRAVSVAIELELLFLAKVELDGIGTPQYGSAMELTGIGRVCAIESAGRSYSVVVLHNSFWRRYILGQTEVVNEVESGVPDTN